ncbi:MAG: hypothetical protein ACI3XR_04070 [Eubacteriales bacterium]
MKAVKYVLLILTLVCLFTAASLENTNKQTAMVVLMFVFFQVWIQLVKNDRKHRGR